jgi:hypothetical protein
MILSSPVFGKGGSDAAEGKVVGGDNPDKLTSDIVDSHEEVPPPSHSQISSSDIQERKAVLRCKKLKPALQQKCLDNLP